MPALARINLIGYGVGGPFSAACTFLTDVYRPGAWKILAPVSLALCLFSLWIALRGKETTRQALLGYGYTMLFLCLAAANTASDATRVTITLALGLVVLAGAMRLPSRPVLAMMMLAAVEIAVIKPVTTSSVLSVILVDSAVASICLLPAVIVLGYRRQLEQALEQITEIARTDPLTGLVNRRGLAEQAGRLVAIAAREGRAVAVLAADLDHFKWINDQFGHAAGDAVLREVAAAISATVRLPDVVARTGGEELCVIALLKGPGSIDILAERVRKTVEQDVARHPVTISVGGIELTPATIIASTESADELLWRVLDQADVLLYEAKGAGRNAVRVLSI